jgi:hypothetical protein
MRGKTEDRHERFRYRSNRDGRDFTDLMEIDVLELPKLPPATDASELWYWLKFIKSDDRGVLEEMQERSPQMRKAVGVLMELSADETTRMFVEEREKARRDIASMIGGARRDGKAEGLI